MSTMGFLIRDIPVLYCSNQIIYENGISKGLRYNEGIDISLARQISKNQISGCTMVFNKALVEQIISKECPPAEIIDFRMHDAWIYLVALLTGMVVYDDDAQILYRIHDRNEVGVRGVTIFEKLGRLIGYGKGGTRRGNLRKKSAEWLLRQYSCIKPEDRAFLEKYANYQKSFKDRLSLLRDEELIKAAGEGYWIFLIKVLMNFV